MRYVLRNIAPRRITRDMLALCRRAIERWVGVLWRLMLEVAESFNLFVRDPFSFFAYFRIHIRKVYCCDRIILVSFISYASYKYDSNFFT